MLRQSPLRNSRRSESRTSPERFRRRRAGWRPNEPRSSVLSPTAWGGRVERCGPSTRPYPVRSFTVAVRCGSLNTNTSAPSRDRQGADRIKVPRLPTDYGPSLIGSTANQSAHFGILSSYRKLSVVQKFHPSRGGRELLSSVGRCPRMCPREKPRRE